MKFSHISTIAAAALTLAMTGAASAATVFTLSADVANSSPSAFGGSVAKTLNDGFAYDPDAPTSALPQQTYNPGAAGFHGSANNGSAKELSYTLSGAHTTTALESVIVIDLYGRAAADCTACVNRDDSIDVTLYNGDYTTVVASIAGISIDNSLAANAWARASFDSLPTGTTFDRVRISGNDTDTDGSNNYFTLLETRAAAIPEPSVSALLGLLGLACLRRRR